MAETTGMRDTGQLNVFFREKNMVLNIAGELTAQCQRKTLLQVAK
jgi:hypothetical protein